MITNDGKQMNPKDESQHRRGGIYECGKCRVPLHFDHINEQYRCPECGWEK